MAFGLPKPEPDGGAGQPPFCYPSSALECKPRLEGALALRTGTYTAIIERCLVTGQYVGHVPALPGARTHADGLDELFANLVEVVTLVLEEEDSPPETEFIGTHTVRV